MKRRQPYRPQRSPIFIGCEGESERGYVAFIGSLAEKAALPVHLDPVILQPGGGDPLDIVRLAIKRLDERRRTKRIPYSAQFVLLDSDKIGINPTRDAQIAALAERAKIGLIWQQPCHEALLLRHLENQTTLRPPTSTLAIEHMSKLWPTYAKPMNAASLAKRLDKTAVLRAAAVEPKLEQLIRVIGLL